MWVKTGLVWKLSRYWVSRSRFLKFDFLDLQLVAMFASSASPQWPPHGFPSFFFFKCKLKIFKTEEIQPNVKSTLNGIQANGTWERREKFFLHSRLLEISESLLSTDFCFKGNYLKPFPFAIINLNYTYHNDIRSIEISKDLEYCYFIIGLFPI